MKKYKYDTHVHTSETSSCGNIGALELVHLYKEQGYDAIVITDHYYNGFFESLGDMIWSKKIDKYLQGYKIAQEEGKKIHLNILLGMEIRFDENFNDYLVFGIDENLLKENKELYKLSLSQFREFASKNQLMIFQAHPFRPSMIVADPNLLDGVEVYNGNMRHNSNNDQALEFAKKNNLKFTSGSDFHELEDLSRGGIFSSELVETSADFVKIFNDNKVIDLITT